MMHCEMCKATCSGNTWGLFIPPELLSRSVSNPEDKLAAYFKTLQKPAGDWFTKDL